MKLEAVASIPEGKFLDRILDEWVISSGGKLRVPWDVELRINLCLAVTMEWVGGSSEKKGLS